MDCETYLKFAQDDVKKWHLPNAENYQNSQPIESIERTAVIGGGTMGRGIAIALCAAGYHVTLIEATEQAKAQCKVELEKVFRRLVAQKLMKKEQENMIWFVLQLSSNLEDAKDVDLVIEAIFEDLEVKKELFRKLSKICKENVLLATNTSTLNLDKMASVTRNPQLFVGMHFFNPPPIMQIVEVVYGQKTSGTAVATAFEITKRMKKIAILAKNSPSFVVNRSLGYYVGQATKLCSQYGFLPKKIDDIVRDFGIPIGPLALMDMNGLDVSIAVQIDFSKEMGLQNKMDPIVEKLCKLERYGRKSGAGWYKYVGTGRRVIDPEVEEMIRKTASDGQNSRSLVFIDQHDILKFMFYPLINEAYKILEDNIVPKAEHIDLMWVLACGWPRSKGGPLKWASEQGYKHILNYLETQYKLTGEKFWKPAQMLVNLANSRL